MPKAYVLTAITRNGERIEPSTERKPVVITLPKDEFNRLELKQVVRTPTDQEILIAGATEVESDDDTNDTDKTNDDSVTKNADNAGKNSGTSTTADSTKKKKTVSRSSDDDEI